MRAYLADLHIHTLLSPCASVEMTPRHIVRRSAQLGINIIAITDHNACDNVAAAIEAAEGTGVAVIPGMEVETREEAHLLTLFETLSQLAVWDAWVRQRRTGRKNDERRFGAQFVVDAADNLVRVEEAMLLGAIDASVNEVTEAVASIGGMTIAAHIDRPAYSLLAQLGFIPGDAGLAAVEVSRLTDWTKAWRMPAIGRLPVITASDAHSMEDLVSGPRTQFILEQAALCEIRLALAGQRERRIAAGGMIGGA
ncbi:MAG: PHP domain-containing protein [Sporomusaceae bacterium]|nr:PHP domain-containing protein [Sporomusaceae bacterium]